MASCTPVRVRAACVLMLLTRSRRFLGMRSAPEKFWAPGPRAGQGQDRPQSLSSIDGHGVTVEAARDSGGTAPDTP